MREVPEVEQREMACPACGDARVFVQPPCVDGHTAEVGGCPEWACADCGTAVFVDLAPWGRVERRAA